MLLEQQYVKTCLQNLPSCEHAEHAMLSECDPSQCSLQVIKDPSNPEGPIYIQPTGTPRALVIQRDISAAAGKIHVVQGPLVPASLVSSLLCVDVQFPGFHHHACVAAISVRADGVSWESMHAWQSIRLWDGWRSTSKR